VKKISLVVGTRPQIIKTQPVVNRLRGMDVEIIHTGQHSDYRMSRLFFEDLGMPEVRKNLNVGKNTPLKQISEIMRKLESHYLKNKPELIIVPGDTTSAVASAIAASKLKIPLAHLEAGGRSNQFYMEEEVNRRMIDHCSNVLFAPTRNCLENLKGERVSGEAFFVGDTMYDLFCSWKRENRLKKHDFSNRVLITVHRAENIAREDNLKKISSFVNRLSKRFEVVFPMHPHTYKQVRKNDLRLDAEIIPPLGYGDMMRQISMSGLIITDSGGLQKEAYWMDRPCITMRESTEWAETIQENANRLMPISRPFSLAEIERIAGTKLRHKPRLYGGGRASERIHRIISNL